MSSSASKRRWPLLALGLGIALLVSLGIVGEAQRRAIAQKHAYDALWTIAQASLDYIRETGRVPTDVDVLVKSGLLQRDSSAGMLLPVVPGRYKPIMSRYAEQTTLHFPASAADYSLSEGVVSRNGSGEPLTVVTCEDLDATSAAYANREIAKDWYLIMTAKRE